MRQKSDSQLIKLYTNGNEKALGILLDRHKDQVYKTIFYKVYDRDLAEDLFQDTFFKIVTNLKQGRYNEEGKFVQWANRIATNLVLDYFRSNKNKKKITETSFNNDDFNILHTLESTEENVESHFINEQKVKDLEKLIEFLPEQQMQIIEMRFYKEMSFKEIAEELEISINTALGRMRYALINLRKIIKEKNIVLN